ncbi:MAG TPA: hypothetical protein VKK79_12185 [Candidatus Lokiarchaeia archaeon]|nr:hypothetical protein [Candidatus Lokiarchaeia archaeon]
MTDEIFDKTNGSYNSIWYSSQARFQRRLKSLIYDHAGSLQITEETIIFSYGSNSIQIPKDSIKKIAFVRSPLSWGYAIAISAFTILSIILFLLPNSYPIGIFALIFGVIALIGYLGTNWVQIRFGNSEGQENVAYFMDGSLLGWGGVLGGTHHFFETLVKWNNYRESN